MGSRKKSAKKRKKWTDKDRRLVQEYLVDFNAEKAAKRAGYSQTTAKTQAYVWVSDSPNNPKPHIRAAIQKGMERLAKKFEITQERVLKEYAKLAFLDPRKFYDEDGQLLPVHKLPEEVAAALSGMDVTTSYDKNNDSVDVLKKIKFADKKAALDSLAKHLGMFKGDKTPLDVNLNLPPTVKVMFSNNPECPKDPKKKS